MLDIQREPHGIHVTSHCSGSLEKTQSCHWWTEIRSGKKKKLLAMLETNLIFFFWKKATSLAAQYWICWPDPPLLPVLVPESWICGPDAASSFLAGGNIKRSATLKGASSLKNHTHSCYRAWYSLPRYPSQIKEIPIIRIQLASNGSTLK